MAAPKIEVDIRDYLTNTTGLSNVYVGVLPPTPINAYAVCEYAGPIGVKVHGAQPGMALDEALIQIMCRHTSQQTGRDNIYLIVDALDGLQDTTISGTLYTYITQASRPRILDREESGATTFIWECRVQSRR